MVKCNISQSGTTIISNVLILYSPKRVHLFKQKTNKTIITAPIGQNHHCITLPHLYLSVLIRLPDLSKKGKIKSIEVVISIAHIIIISCPWTTYYDTLFFNDKMRCIMTDEQKLRPSNTKLQAEIDAKLAQHRMPKSKKKPRTRIEKMTLVMSWVMVVLMVGSVFYAAVSALGWL